MADQHSVRSKQAGKGADMGEGHPLSDEMDIFDQLQNEFDTLISGDAQDTLPLETSAETAKDLGELFTPDEASDDDNQETMDHERDKTIAGKEGKVDAKHETGAPPMQETADKTLPPSVHSTVAKTTQTSAAKVSARHPQTTKKTSGMPASTIMMIGLAVVIIMAAVAGSIWTFNYPGSQQAASNGQAAEDLRQVIIKKPPRAVKYIPVDKAASITSKQSAAPAAKPVAAATSRHASGQSAASHDKAGHSSATPARNGNWIINLESFNTQNDANAYAAKLEQRHIQADIVAIQIKGKAWYRVRLTGFPSKREAEIQRLILVKKLNLNSAWISKSRH